MIGIASSMNAIRPEMLGGNWTTLSVCSRVYRCRITRAASSKVTILCGDGKIGVALVLGSEAAEEGWRGGEVGRG